MATTEEDTTTSTVVTTSHVLTTFSSTSTSTAGSTSITTSSVVLPSTPIETSESTSADSSTSITSSAYISSVASSSTSSATSESASVDSSTQKSTTISTAQPVTTTKFKLTQTIVDQIIAKRDAEAAVEIARIANQTSALIAQLQKEYQVEDDIGEVATIIASIFLALIYLSAMLCDLMNFCINRRKRRVHPKKKKITKLKYYNFTPEQNSSNLYA